MGTYISSAWLGLFSGIAVGFLVGAAHVLKQWMKANESLDELHKLSSGLKGISLAVDDLYDRLDHWTKRSATRSSREKKETSGGLTREQILDWARKQAHIPNGRQEDELALERD